MAKRAFVVLFSILLLGGASPAAGKTLEEDLAPFVQAAHRTVDTTSTAAGDAARRSAEAARSLGGPVAALADQIVPFVEGAGGSAGDVFAAVGEGTTVVDHTTAEYTCPAMRAVVAHRRPMSNEVALFYEFHGSQASPATICGVGWRGGFRPHEIQGDPDQGWTGRIRAIDADVDMVISPVRADGTRSYWLRQVTFPQGSGNGFGHVLDFNGVLVDVA